jgi:pyrroloquinoline quinone (PQQ) biosynthesis protein C
VLQQWRGAAHDKPNERRTMNVRANHPTVDISKFVEEVRELANAQFESPQYKRLLAIPLTVERARRYVLQKAYWNINRRDCWGYSQGPAPMDVKKLIWEHEEDELAGNKERGVEDHYSLQVRQSAQLGLSLEDFVNEVPSDATKTISYAYIHLVKDSPWLKAFAACVALEISNSAEWVKGGGMSYRWGKKQEAELNFPFHKQLNAAEHAEVDVLHAHMLLKVVERHATTQAALDLVMEGLKDSWAIDRVWKGQLAEMLEALPPPAR